MEKAETVIVTVFALAMAYFLVGSVLALADPTHQILIWGFSK